MEEKEEEQHKPNDDYSDEYISRIEELGHLLHTEGADTDSAVCQWYNTFGENVKHYSSCCEDSVQKDLSVLQIPQLVRLLRDRMLTHRWPEALPIMNAVCRAPVGTSYTIWKAGMELLLKEPDANSDLIQQLYNQMKQLPDLTTKELVMEYSTFLLHQGNTESAITALQENLLRGGVKKERTAHNDYTDVLFRAYMGLVWYMEWHACKRKIDGINTQPDDNIFDDVAFQSMSQTMSLRSQEMQMDSLAKKAILGFEATVDAPGVWDIFITKHVELLEYDGKLDEAQEILQKYRDNNPDNTNSHVYLYEFYSRHQPGSDNVTQQLKAIADKVPSHPLVLELCGLLEKDVGAAVPYLFTMLDYPCWQGDLAPWKMLAHCLEVVTIDSEGKADDSILTQCWSGRKSWWPAFHFSKHQAVQDKGTSDLVFPKAVIATILCGKDNDYTTTSMDHLSSTELAHLETISPSNNSGVT